MKRNFLLGSCSLLLILSTYNLYAAPIYFVAADTKTAWEAAISDSSTTLQNVATGNYNTANSFEIGWNSATGEATFRIGGASTVVIFSELLNMKPTYIALIGNDSKNQYGYSVSLTGYPGITSGLSETGTQTEILNITNASNFTLSGSFTISQLLGTNAAPGNDTVNWSIVMDNFTPVPIPSAILLLAPGILGIALIRRRSTPKR